nr:immunoglobulin light chain junction region [Macaca mulatta]
DYFCAIGHSSGLVLF